MNPALLGQWQRLIFPPDGLPVRAGEQLRTGNRYPDSKGCPDWAAHVAGRRTYAVNPVYPGPDGAELCKFAVLDIDEHGDSLGKARALLAVCHAAGLEARAAWSGGKGCHVWLFFEPAPVGVVRAVLAKLRAAVPFTGETIPGENSRAKLPPAFHQEARKWAFWFASMPDIAPALETPPTGFLDAQAGILAAVVPSPVSTLAAYANAGAGADRREPEPDAAMVPDLGKLGGELPPCVRALVEHGAQTALGSWDKNALTLARYAVTAGLSPEAGAALLETLADNTGPDFLTGKDRDAQRRQWRSIRNPGPFGCGFILAARKTLGFRCADCAARPAGVKAGAGKAEPLRDNAPGPQPDTELEAAALFLEPALADSLLQLALQGGLPEAPIDPAIFPDVALPDNDPRTGKPARAALHALGWGALGAGYRTAAAMLNHLDRQADPPTPPYKCRFSHVSPSSTGNDKMSGDMGRAGQGSGQPWPRGNG